VNIGREAHTNEHLATLHHSAKCLSGRIFKLHDKDTAFFRDMQIEKASVSMTDALDKLREERWSSLDRSKKTRRILFFSYTCISDRI